ncbi:DUF4136 domain-containing protein [Brumicola nitratireducens]|uniref:Putative lipoprotein n=1 Tax=Glaciecola nitratireducens (strain JCM 12485 / KCTC 12276 / FR1064) TaxID=1085623 RepID=G4QML6_GLANF|nr:DUF4136 domain-containing protein [Glaciecola nitratireducens]AEP30968.1 putative lipoprotein [Glaciecola nitratireducens FR1064]
MSTKISLIVKSIILLMWTSILFSCASTPKIHSLVDDRVQFNKYQTYTFHPSVSVEGDNYDSMSSRYIKLAIQNEMQKKGFRQAEDADLWVNFNVYVHDKLTVDTSPSISLYYGFRRDYGVWGNYPMLQERIQQYTEGTLNIDLIDRKTNLLLWEGVAIGKVTSRTYDNLEFKINEAVKLMFETLPKD